MKRILILGLVVVVALAMVIPATLKASAGNGNGAPSGAHFNLNIIGVPKGKTADITSGNRIFVPLWGSTKILLGPGPYAVLDGNGTDGSASFQLPNPDPDGDGVTTYSVWARALGKPNGTSTTTTCFTDFQTSELYCSIYSMVLVRTKGQQKFVDYSKELLFVYADIDADGVVERVPLFSDTLDQFYWQYDNSGLKLAQLRFYEVPSTVP